VYGFSLAGLPSYTRMFGHVFAPAVTLVFVIKPCCSAWRWRSSPWPPGLYDTGERTQPDSELGGLARMFAVLLLIEIGSLVGNYY
jgi:phospholipid/cholesterol/gamma-HCH transport system permease protein